MYGSDLQGPGVEESHQSMCLVPRETPLISLESQEKKRAQVYLTKKLATLLKYTVLTDLSTVRFFF